MARSVNAWREDSRSSRDRASLRRLMRYVFHYYPVRITPTVVCIILAAVAFAAGLTFHAADRWTTSHLASRVSFDAVRGTLVRLRRHGPPQRRCHRQFHLHPRHGDCDAGGCVAHETTCWTSMERLPCVFRYAPRTARSCRRHERHGCDPVSSSASRSRLSSSRV